MSKTITLPKNAKINEGKLNVHMDDVMFPVESDPSIEVYFSYFAGSEIVKYYDGQTIDLNKVFVGKVKEIVGLTVTDEEGNTTKVTPEMMVQLPSFATISAQDNLTVGTFIAKIASEIIDKSRLNEDEAKN